MSCVSQILSAKQKINLSNVCSVCIKVLYLLLTPYLLLHPPLCLQSPATGIIWTRPFQCIYQQRSYSIIHFCRQSVTLCRKRDFLGSYSRQTAEDSYGICPSNLYIVLSICLLFGVLDRFLDFKFSQFLFKIEG